MTKFSFKHIVLFSSSLLCLQASADYWTCENDGPRSGSQTKVTPWKLSGSESMEILKKGPKFACQAAPGAGSCKVERTESHEVSWAKAHSLTKKIKLNPFTFAGVEVGFVDTETKTKSSRISDSFSQEIDVGYQAQYHVFIPRKNGTASAIGYYALSYGNISPMCPHWLYAVRNNVINNYRYIWNNKAFIDYTGKMATKDPIGTFVIKKG